MKKTLLIALVLAGALSLTACAGLDVIGQGSVQSFGELAEWITRDEAGCYTLAAPDGSARFTLSEDFSAQGPDAALWVDAQPFVSAGLDVEKLPADILHQDGGLLIGTELSQKAPAARQGAADAWRQAVEQSPASLSYHMEMDHYGLSFPGGHAFEWAKDLAENDKDIVFALDPAPFVQAGVDPEAVEGWTYAQISATGSNGKHQLMFKLLKPFNLK